MKIDLQPYYQPFLPHVYRPSPARLRYTHTVLVERERHRMSFEPDDTSRHFVIKLKEKEKEKEKMRIIESLVSPFWCFLLFFWLLLLLFFCVPKGAPWSESGAFFLLIKFPYLAQMVSH